MNQQSAEASSVAIVGGGLAGLAAGCALSEAGFRVSLFERRPFLGGRASSYQHPGTGEVVDNCQHVLLGCCTNLIAFYQRIGVLDKIRWYNQLTFLEPGGRASTIGASWLPAPFHSAPAFLGARCLKLPDKLAVGRAMLSLISSQPADAGESFLGWLKAHRQTQRAIDRFWEPVLVSALNEDLDRISLHYAAQVFRESFLKSARAGQMGVPRVPLTELYNAAGDYIRRRRGEIQYRAAVDSFRVTGSEVWISSAGKEHAFEYLILAVPFDLLASLLPDSPDSDPFKQCLANFESSPITGIHLWFDRSITDLDHAVLLDRTIQWMFHKSRLLDRKSNVDGDGEESATKGSYVELVVSSSKSLVDKSRSEIVQLAVYELGEFLPATRQARLVKSTVIKEVHATYSPRPGIDRYRPLNATSWPRVFLAGDWTATGWPATMEGAVRSGYLAAQGLARAAR
ncbi:MAG TPA: hydroxysqualene dehydroxylase HpnE, partial [Terriglobales bacterium]